MSSFKSEFAINDVARRFVDRSLLRSEWTHTAHFAVALWLLRHRGGEAVHDMPPLIRAFNEASGVANTHNSGYHETITVASLRATRAWLKDRPDAAGHVVLEDMMATALGRSDWLFSYWSKDVLMTPTARSTWVEPDLKPLPYPAF